MASHDCGRGRDAFFLFNSWTLDLQEHGRRRWNANCQPTCGMGDDQAGGTNGARPAWSTNAALLQPLRQGCEKLAAAARLAAVIGRSGRSSAWPERLPFQRPTLLDALLAETMAQLLKLCSCRCPRESSRKKTGATAFLVPAIPRSCASAMIRRLFLPAPRRNLERRRICSRKLVSSWERAHRPLASERKIRLLHKPSRGRCAAKSIRHPPSCPLRSLL
jgi:hypothetical protein